MPLTLQNRPSGAMTGGRALAEMLHLSGAGPMFGMGGFQLLPFYDAIGIVGLTHHLINDERCGAFAADAYARVTNRPGICDATLGPGATNLVTGLVESLNGGIPIVAITGATFERTADVLIADANTGWLMHDALRVVRAVRDVDVYIEQPCLTYEECLTIRRHCDHPFVLDEVIDSMDMLLRGHADRA